MTHSATFPACLTTPARLIPSSVLLFRRIFNFEKAQVAQIEKRLNQRYAPGPAFPLRTMLMVGSQSWPAKVENISVDGLALQVPAEAAALPDQPARVKLELDDYLLEINATLVHARAQDKDLSCGLRLEFEDYQLQKTYLQLLQPIAIGQSLKVVPLERVTQNEPQFIKHVFRDDSDSVLMVWQEKTAGTPVHNFEFQMQDYFCRADAKHGELDAYLRDITESPFGKIATANAENSSGVQDEIRRLYRWIVPNLPATIPPDILAFLQRFAR